MQGQVIGAIDDLTLGHLLRDICAGIRVLQTRDGIELSEVQILDRARNIVMGLVGNYRIVSLDDDAPAAMPMAVAQRRAA